MAEVGACESIWALGSGDTIGEVGKKSRIWKFRQFGGSAVHGGNFRERRSHHELLRPSVTMKGLGSSRGKFIAGGDIIVLPRHE